MKRVLVILLMLTIVLAGCNNGEKYKKDIDKVYKEQEKLNKEISLFSDKVNTKIDRDKSNTYVYKDGKVIIIGIQLFKKENKLHYFYYNIKDGKAKFDEEADPMKYMKKHDADYEEENQKVEKK